MGSPWSRGKICFQHNFIHYIRIVIVVGLLADVGAHFQPTHYRATPPSISSRGERRKVWACSILANLNLISFGKFAVFGICFMALF